MIVRTSAIQCVMAAAVLLAMTASVQAGLGDSQANAAFSATQILQSNPGAPTGLYWIDPDGGSVSNSFQVFCDMVSDGGGWELVANVANGWATPGAAAPFFTTNVTQTPAAWIDNGANPQVLTPQSRGVLAVRSKATNRAAQLLCSWR